MSTLFPDQVRVLSDVLDSVDIEIAAALQLTREDVNDVLSLCFEAVRKHASTLSSRRWVFSLDIGAKGGKPLHLSHILSACDGGTPIISLTRDGKFAKSSAGGVRLTDAEKRTAASGGIDVVVHGTYVYLVLAGSTINEFDLVNQSSGPPVGIVLFRSIQSFSEILRDHIEHEIEREKGVKYWKDSRRRILLASPENTEKIFQRALLRWLRLFVVDKLRIVSETRGFGQDATDITIITTHGDYVIEVKWMGKNEKGTKFDGDQISVGMKQVGIYLDNDDRLVRGSLVIYDGRAEGSSSNDSPDWSCLHSSCERPYVVFLQSDPPSVVAARKS